MSILKTKAIVIRTTKYAETSMIISCYTDLHGLQSYIINGVRSKNAAIKPSQLQALTLLELEAYYQQNKTMQRIKELKCLPVLNELHFNVIKSSIALFISEVLNKLIRDENNTDEHLFTYLFNAIQILDISQENCANFPLVFLTQLTRYLGFSPKGEFRDEQNGFDIKEGAFIPYDSRNPYQLNPMLSKIVSDCLHNRLDQFSQIVMTYDQRTNVLEHMLDYYREHIQGIFDIQSHKILSEVLKE